MNKRIKILTKILLFTIFLILIMQTNAFATQIPSIDTPSIEITENKITNIEITGFNNPIVGLKPTFSATASENANYKVVLESWYGNGKMIESKENDSITNPIDVFEKDVNYTYEIYINPTDDSTFADDVTATIDGQTLTLSRFAGKSAIFELSYGNAQEVPLVTNIEITDVTMPVAGEKPTLTATVPENANYRISSEFWYDDEAKTQLDAEFEAGKSYTYYSMVYPATGSIFGSNVTATVNGNEMKFESNEGNLLVFSYNVVIPASDDTNNDETNQPIKNYNITEGNNQTWNGKGDLRIVCDGEFDKFESLLIGLKDANRIPILEEDVDYTVESGSTIVTVKESYLKNLAVGDYNVIFVYTDGEATASLKVAEVKTEETDNDENKNENNNTNNSTNDNKNNGFSNPQTGDKIILCIAVLGTAIIALMATKFNKK